MWGSLLPRQFLSFFFGDSKAYFESKRKVVTVGLNPSRAEFPKGDRYSRFARARDVYPEILDGRHHREYLEALNGYFRNAPYRKWFNSYEPLLNGFGASYYNGQSNTALHTDLCSPLATDPTWSRLSQEQKAMLQASGIALWHELLRTLEPDAIICSVAKQHLGSIGFPLASEWKTIHTVQRANPYHVEAIKINVCLEKRTVLVFGRAAQIPLATISANDRRRIGESLQEYVCAE